MQPSLTPSMGQREGTTNSLRDQWATREASSNEGARNNAEETGQTRREKEAQNHERSKGLECSICLEEIVNKERKADRRFAIMSGCDHVFCLPCMRGWRYGQQSSTMEHQARKCPECQVRQLPCSHCSCCEGQRRKSWRLLPQVTSHFIIPSTYFPQTPEEREELFRTKKEHMAQIPCKHFDYGRGQCPFGSSCFFAHIYPDGSRERSTPRKAADDEGNVKPIPDVQLSSFLSQHPAFARGNSRA